MSLSAKRVLTWLLGCVLILIAVGIIGVEVWHQHSLSVVTASVAVGAGIWGGLIVAPKETKENARTLIGWVREFRKPGGAA